MFLKISRNFVFVISLITLGCKTTGGSDPRDDAKQPLPPAGYQPAKAEPIQLIGENCCARFNPIGDELIFLSRKRSRHEQYQVYSYDLKNKKERRISFHDGDDQGPTYERNGEFIYYASITDIEKENPKFLQEALGKESKGPASIGPRPAWIGQPFELYRAAKDGTGIIRLTHNDFFDGEIDVSPAGKGYVHTGWRDGKSQLLRAFESSGTNNGLNLIKNTDHLGEPRFSADGLDLVFVVYATDGATSQIWTVKQNGKRPQKLNVGQGLNISPSWSPDGKEILYSSNQNPDGAFEIYVMKQDGSCVRRLTYQLGDDSLPEFAPDGKSLLFSSNRSGQWQIYTMPYSPPNCPNP